MWAAVQAALAVVKLFAVCAILHSIAMQQYLLSPLGCTDVEGPWAKV